MMTRWMTVLSGKTDSPNTALFNPLTPAMNSAGVVAVKFALEIKGSKVKCQPAVQYSADGIVWDTAVAIDPDNAGLWKAAANLPAYYADYIACPAGFDASSPPTERLFVRFGVFVYNSDASDTKAHQGQVRLTVTPIAVVAGSATQGPVVTPTGGSSTELFTPVVGPLSTASIAYVRYSWELQARTGTCATRPGYQTSDDGFTWSVAVDSALSPRTSNGITYGTTFASIDLTDARYVRFGIIAENDGGSGDPEAGQSWLRVDWRGE
jgi:hypothetical protein